MEPLAMLNAIMRERVHPLLRDKGFARKGRTWNRQVGTLVQSIHVQTSRWNSRDEVEFTVNVGVYDVLVDEIVWAQLHGKPRQIATIINTRIGRLAFGGRYMTGSEGGDEWWTLDTSSRLEAVGDAVADALSTRALPFLDQMRTREAVLSFLESHPNHSYQLALEMINRSVLLTQLDRRDEAREVLAEVVASGNDWGDLAQITAARLDLQLDDEASERVR